MSTLKVQETLFWVPEQVHSGVMTSFEVMAFPSSQGKPKNKQEASDTVANGLKLQAVASVQPATPAEELEAPGVGNCSTNDEVTKGRPPSGTRAIQGSIFPPDSLTCS